MHPYFLANMLYHICSRARAPFYFSPRLQVIKFDQLGGHYLLQKLSVCTFIRSSFNESKPNFKLKKMFVTVGHCGWLSWTLFIDSCLAIVSHYKLFILKALYLLKAKHYLLKKMVLTVRLYDWSSLSQKDFCLVIIDPFGQPTVTAGRDHCFCTCPFVRTYVRPHFSNLAKQNKAKTMFATCETVSLAEWIFNDTCLISNYSFKGTVPSPGAAVYSGSKAAIAQFAKNLALEEAGNGIRVNIISPGFIATDLFKNGGIPVEK